jgi:hypothetical protein
MVGRLGRRVCTRGLAAGQCASACSAGTTTRKLGTPCAATRRSPLAQPPARRAANNPRWWVAAAASGVAMVWGVWLVSAPVQPGGMVATQAPAPATTWVALEQAHPQHAEVLAEHRAVSPSALRMPVGFARNVAWSGQ